MQFISYWVVKRCCYIGVNKVEENIIDVFLFVFVFLWVFFFFSSLVLISHLFIKLIKQVNCK